MLRAWNELGRLDAALTGGSLPSTGSDGVLMFHSVGDRGFEDIDPDVFRRLLGRLNRSVTFVDLSDLFEESSTDRRIALTFDDGYEGFHNHVVPILKDFDAPATVFVVAGTLTDDSLNIDEAVRGRYMTPAQLSAVADEDLVTIGNHTMTHPNLQTVTSCDRLETEIVTARSLLETEFGAPVDRFCYPYNDLTPAALSVVRESHDYAVCDGGWRESVSVRTNPYLIPRINGAREWWRVRWHLLDRSTHLARAGDELRSLLRSLRR